MLTYVEAVCAMDEVRLRRKIHGERFVPGRMACCVCGLAQPALVPARARVLLCGHVVCLACATALCDEDGTPHPTPDPVDGPAPVASVQACTCPVVDCARRQPFTLVRAPTTHGALDAGCSPCHNPPHDEETATFVQSGPPPVDAEPTNPADQMTAPLLHQRVAWLDKGTGVRQGSVARILVGDPLALAPPEFTLAHLAQLKLARPNPEAEVSLVVVVRPPGCTDELPPPPPPLGGVGVGGPRLGAGDDEGADEAAAEADVGTKRKRAKPKAGSGRGKKAKQAHRVSTKKLAADLPEGCLVWTQVSELMAGMSWARRVGREGTNLVTGWGSKLDAIVARLRQLRSGPDPVAKALVFSQWSDALVLLQDALTANSVPSAMLAGGRKSAAALARFRSDPSVVCLLMPLHSTNAGLNLNEATHVFLLDTGVQHEPEVQALARVKRLNSTRATHVHRFVMHGTIEEAIWNLRQQRANRCKANSNSHASAVVATTEAEASSLAANEPERTAPGADEDISEVRRSEVYAMFARLAKWFE